MPLALLTVLIAMLSIQFGASLAKGLFPILGPVGASTWRLCLAALFLAILWKPWKIKLTMLQLRLIIYYGLSLSLMNILFYLAIDRIPLGVAVALEFTGPLVLTVSSSKNLRDLVWTFLATIGLLLLFPWSQRNSLDILGLLLALGAGGCWALYIVFAKKVGRSIHSGKAVSLGMIVAALFTIPFGVILSGPVLWKIEIIPLASLVALFSSALPYSLEMFALKKIEAPTFGILMSLEPALAAIMGWFFLFEKLSLFEIVAICSIIAASLGATISSKKSHTSIQMPLEQ